MDCPGGPDVITMVLISERGRHESQHYKKKFEDRAVIRVIEEGTMSHGSQVASRSWKRQGNKFSAGDSKRNEVPFDALTSVH